jgi:hypothetical protein
VSKQLFLVFSSSSGGDAAEALAVFSAFEAFMRDLAVLFTNELNVLEQGVAALLADVSLGAGGPPTPSCATWPPCPPTS